LNLGAVTGERLIDCVIYDLVDEVVEAAFSGRADIHSWALADRLKALEDGDRRGVVALLLLAHHASNGRQSKGLKRPLEARIARDR
jgi:hypothetical protein